MINYIDADGAARYIRGTIVGSEKVFGVRFAIIRRTSGTQTSIPEAQLIQGRDNMGHTPGSLQIITSDNHRVLIADCSDLAETLVTLGEDDLSLANADHLVACWNACEGINPEAVPALLEALEEIAKGEGAFSRDPLEHAGNTIDNLKSIAKAAIALTTERG